MGAPGGGLSNATLDVVKHFALVTLEKWQGSKTTPYMWEEDAWVRHVAPTLAFLSLPLSLPLPLPLAWPLRRPQPDRLLHQRVPHADPRFD